MSRLNYHHLYYFWRVALLGNLTQAAKELHISQSALSTQIKQLEHTINVNLFERKGRSLELTDMGKRVLAYANDIFSTGEELSSFLSKGAIAEKQHLSIGVLNTLSRNFIEEFINPLLSSSSVTFSLTARRMDGLLNGLAEHELDLVLTNKPVGTEHHNELWQSQLVSRQPLAIVGPADGKISSEFPIGYENAQWVLPSKTSAIRDSFNALCARWQYKPEIKAEADDMAMLRLLARDSGALSVLPSVVVKDEIEQGVLIEYQRLPDAYEHFYAITAQRKFVPDSLKQLLAVKC
ncbi:MULTISPECIES: LysR family transcriptional regulator [Pseudoalteromonas]|uniref:LysR family transcriptional regulator n=1 Tax=Pseudoalteromonas TaxID=53246 RepID=UPI0016024A40|nr:MULTISPECIES: LysR family transcriptional regulator [Pseudoalteromonas]MBB1291592.1 LysR family transcriptional regulator [Pseudoalteromonas sp. SR41-4]MBB1303353.1 LysR family transcriptional regulator [Pseudoalteromonas sp. SR44-8]MBB1307922.1 LysR family transcriptional regulator [Pseudoalteromonas sp. SR41-8]MBB1398527.1 LysR family transcriptional regulator [Pseudoalteromonas sp. SG44-8]MBB1409941.1 LysR family transcriptional regulator [Pseudoalteromonas sp. SG44-17]